MKKIYLLIVLVLIISSRIYSQKGNNQIGVGGRLDFPIKEFHKESETGVGGYLKGLYGIGKSGQITLTSGINIFHAPDGILSREPGATKITHTIVPILAGYRHYFKNFFIEPAVGYSLANFKMKRDSIFYLSGIPIPTGGDYSLSSWNFTYSAGIGFQKKGFEIGTYYQGRIKDNGATAMTIGIQLGYNFSLGKKR